MSVEPSRFEGVERADGSVGIRNRVLVLPSVICSRQIASRIADAVDAAVCAPHDHGCAQIGADKEQTLRTFLGLAANPNVSGTVVVGLGCESIQSRTVAEGLEKRDLPVHELSIQGIGGTDACLERGIELASELASGSRSTARRNASLGDLTVGVVSGDLDPSTTEVADPLVGEFVRTIVDAGGRAIVAGVERAGAHPDDAIERAVDDAAAERIERVLDGRHSLLTRTEVDAKEASFAETTRAWGELPIEDALSYGERATHESGVALVDAPSRFEEAATALAAAGAQLVVHVTADGVPAGHPLVPVVKVSGDRETVEALAGDIDVDATDATVEDLCEYVIGVAEGAPTRAEVHGLRTFAITRIGPSM